ncbi:MAG: orotate phosphoribosyltransferase [Chitinivibrionales bacterium]
MKQYKQDFITFMVRSGVLTFGDFVTKSGRRTPFFINTGNYRTGEQMNRLGEFYAQAIIDAFGEDFTVLFGPAYKGIPLVVTTAGVLAREHDKNVSFCFNRKEKKAHGEGGSLVGYQPQSDDSIVIVEDVTTAGTSIRETVPILKAAADVTITGLVVSVDRMEKGTAQQSALQEIQQSFGMKTTSIVNLEEIVTFLHNREIDGIVVLTDLIFEQIQIYRQRYGV